MVQGGIFDKEVMMKKILFYIYILAIVITPCAAQQNNDSIGRTDELDHIVFGWQYSHHINDININFINLNPIFFGNSFINIDTWGYMRKNYRQQNNQTAQISSNENNVGNFIAGVGAISLLFVPNSMMNKYQRDIYKNYNQEQSVNEKIYR